MIKLQWLRGKSLGLAMIYLGIMSFFQLIFIALGQYAMKVGSRPITVLVPIAVIMATFYSVLVNFETNTTMNEFRSTHQYKHKKVAQDFKRKFRVFLKNIYVRPVLIVISVFTILFFFTWLILFGFIEESWIVFIIAENVGALGVILFISYLEKSTGRKIR